MMLTDDAPPAVFDDWLNGSLSPGSHGFCTPCHMLRIPHSSVERLRQSRLRCSLIQVLDLVFIFITVKIGES